MISQPDPHTTAIGDALRLLQRDTGRDMTGPLAALAALESERDELLQTARRWERTCDGAINAYEAAEARVTQLEEALTEIDRYSCYGTPWNAYVDVKRIAKQALARYQSGTDVVPDAALSGMEEDGGRWLCSECGMQQDGEHGPNTLCSRGKEKAIALGWTTTDPPRVADDEEAGK